MEYDFSIVVLSYFPTRNKLLTTLNSIILQENISFEIVIADDGSEQFYENDIHEFMEKHHFFDYRVLANRINQGTVKNLVGALEVCHGRYVKVISPGDYLYYPRTLADLKDFMNEKEAEIAFGDMAYYSYEEKDLQIYNMKNPWDCSIYEDDFYSQEKVIRHMMLYSDSVCGASVVAERKLLLEQLKRIQDVVIYAEDIVVQLMAILGYRIWRYPDIIVWYEYGSGISTNGNLGYSPRIRNDFCNFMQWVTENYPSERHARTMLKIRKYLENGQYIFIYIHRLLHWGELLFVIRRRLFFKKYVAQKPHRTFFDKVYINDNLE